MFLHWNIMYLYKFPQFSFSLAYGIELLIYGGC